MRPNPALMVHSILQKFLLTIRTVPVNTAGLNSNVQMDSTSTTILTISKFMATLTALGIHFILQMIMNHSDGVV